MLPRLEKAKSKVEGEDVATDAGQVQRTTETTMKDCVAANRTT